MAGHIKTPKFPTKTPKTPRKQWQIPGTSSLPYIFKDKS